MRTLAVVPAYNEEATVAEVVAGINAAGLPALVVDDGSEDRTSEEAASAGARVVRLPVNIGVGGAMRTGFAYAVDHGFSRAVQVDADLQHDPRAIPDLLEAADDEDAALVIGSRFGSAGYRASPLRRVPMRVLAWLIRRRTGIRLDDVTSGFRVISEPLLTHFATEYPTEYLGDTVEAILMASRHGARIHQVPVRMSPRRSGRATSTLDAAGHVLRVSLVILARSPRST